MLKTPPKTSNIPSIAAELMNPAKAPEPVREQLPKTAIKDPAVAEEFRRTLDPDRKKLERDLLVAVVPSLVANLQTEAFSRVLNGGQEAKGDVGRIVKSARMIARELSTDFYS